MGWAMKRIHALLLSEAFYMLGAESLWTTPLGGCSASLARSTPPGFGFPARVLAVENKLGIVLVWQDGASIYTKRMVDGNCNMDHNTTKVKRTDEFFREPRNSGLEDVAGYGDKQVVATWTVGGNIWVRIVDTEGTSDGGPMDSVLVNVASKEWSTRTNVRVVATPSSVGGGFVVVWSSWGQDSDGWGVFARPFNTSGLPSDDEVQVNIGTDGFQWLPELQWCGTALWASWVNGSNGKNGMCKGLVGGCRTGPFVRLLVTLPDRHSGPWKWNMSPREKNLGRDDFLMSKVLTCKNSDKAGENGTARVIWLTDSKPDAAPIHMVDIAVDDPALQEPAANNASDANSSSATAVLTSTSTVSPQRQLGNANTADVDVGSVVAAATGFLMDDMSVLPFALSSLSNAFFELPTMKPPPSAAGATPLRSHTHAGPGGTESVQPWSRSASQIMATLFSPGVSSVRPFLAAAGVTEPDSQRRFNSLGGLWLGGISKEPLEVGQIDMVANGGVMVALLSIPGEPELHAQYVDVNRGTVSQPKPVWITAEGVRASLTISGDLVLCGAPIHRNQDQGGFRSNDYTCFKVKASKLMFPDVIPDPSGTMFLVIFVAAFASIVFARQCLGACCWHGRAIVRRGGEPTRRTVGGASQVRARQIREQLAAIPTQPTQVDVPHMTSTRISNDVDNCTPSGSRATTSATDSTRRNDSFTCTICQNEVLVRVALQKCGHTACRDCVTRLFDLNQKCHICRAPIEGVLPVYL
eukprot:TRINITY_DN28780_c0_g1_i1.p1 TRINITY_DN28780_c0_g1~~TRINITY_DN28780_c0_g1_i1.p1  ORF type:complete len:752 (-),score=88.65 TRINITY_DN28780_c0_g1_i1:33-2288(-)